MSAPPETPQVRIYQRWARIASGLTVLVGVLVLIGWISGNDPLKRLIPGNVFMKANTAMAFIFAGAALLLWQRGGRHPWRSTAPVVLSTLVLAIGLLTGCEYLFGWDLGIDQLLISETLEVGGVFPGRLAPATAAGFVFVGLSLLSLAAFRRANIAQILILPALLLSLVAMTGYLYETESLYRVGALTPIALPTAITMAVLAAGILLAWPEEGWIAVAGGEGPAGALARRMLPGVILLPILLGYLRVLAEASGRYEAAVVQAVATAANVTIYTALIAWSIAELHGIDRSRRRADEEIHQLNRELEKRVLERTAELESVNAMLHEERDLVQALMDNVPDTIYFKDTASRFTRVNRAQARVLGLNDVQAPIGKTDADYFPADVAAASYADEQTILKTSQALVDRREFVPTADGQERWFSSTKMPLLDQHGSAVGLMGISRDITRHIRNQAALEAANASLNERIAQMALIIELDEQLQGCVSEAEVFHVTARLVGRLFPEEQGAVYAIDAAQNCVQTAVTWGTPPLPSQTFELDDCWALRRGRPHYSGGDRAGELCRHMEDAPPTYSLCLPLSAGGEGLGILHLRTAPGGELRDSTEIQKQSALLTADSLAQAWANVQLRQSLREQSIRDPLTGLYNRRHMLAFLDRELRRAARNNSTVGVIMLDIDRFKQINDAYGHAAGDEVLRGLGEFLLQHTRGGDIACRYGGEEFVVILSDTGLDELRARAEQLHQQFGSMRISHDDRILTTPTLSVGVAAYPKHGTSTDDLLRAADVALYKAKTAGRNRVVVAE